MTSTDERTVAFIAEIGETSRYLAARNDLYASVMIAQPSWNPTLDNLL